MNGFGGKREERSSTYTKINLQMLIASLVQEVIPLGSSNGPLLRDGNLCAGPESTQSKNSECAVLGLN